MSAVDRSLCVYTGAILCPFYVYMGASQVDGRLLGGRWLLWATSAHVHVCSRGGGEERPWGDLGYGTGCPEGADWTKVGIGWDKSDWDVTGWDRTDF